MMSLEYLRVLVEFSRKRHKNSKIWDFWGSYAAAKVHAAAKAHATVKGSYATTWLRRKNGSTSSFPWRSHCSQHGKLLFLVLFCYSVAPRTRLLD